MNPIDTIAAAFDPLKPAIAKGFVQWITRALTKLENDRPGFVMARDDKWTRQGNTFRQFRRFLQPIDPKNYRVNAPLRIAHERIREESTRYADDQVAAFVSKLRKKLGALDTAEIRKIDINQFTFTITGTANGHGVRVDQQCVFKLSTNGKLFNQWPARIYVDGKFTPESKFRAAIAA